MRRKGNRFGFGRGRRDCCGQQGCGHRSHQPLSAGSLLPGERAVIEQINCTGGHRRRLLSVGMAPGKEVVCVRARGRHGLCLRVGESEYFVNGNMAEQIRVRRESEVPSS